MYIDSVYLLSNRFMKDAKFVKINEPEINEFAKKMKTTVPRRFDPPEDPFDPLLETLSHLIASSINYCYWYGKNDIRPNDSSSGKMYHIVENTVKHFKEDVMVSNTRKLKKTIRFIIEQLADERFPMLEERKNHLLELVRDGYKFSEFISKNNANDYQTLNDHMGLLIRKFPGFASDMFLKRASLFFLMLHRRFGWYKDGVKMIHVPADYQVPKLMHFFRLIDYTSNLRHRIENNILIEKYSQMECEIRAATVLTCLKLCKLTEWNTSEVDAWFWLRRNECNSPFHLTITTDY